MFWSHSIQILKKNGRTLDFHFLMVCRQNFFTVVSVINLTDESGRSRIENSTCVSFTRGEGYFHWSMFTIGEHARDVPARDHNPIHNYTQETRHTTGHTFLLLTFRAPLRSRVSRFFRERRGFFLEPEARSISITSSLSSVRFVVVRNGDAKTLVSW